VTRERKGRKKRWGGGEGEKNVQLHTSVVGERKKGEERGK